jgi:hypothetical protein
MHREQSRVHSYLSYLADFTRAVFERCANIYQHMPRNLHFCPVQERL